MFAEFAILSPAPRECDATISHEFYKGLRDSQGHAFSTIQVEHNFEEGDSRYSEDRDCKRIYHIPFERGSEPNPEVIRGYVLAIGQFPIQHSTAGNPYSERKLAEPEIVSAAKEQDIVIDDVIVWVVGFGERAEVHTYKMIHCEMPAIKISDFYSDTYVRCACPRIGFPSVSDDEAKGALGI